MSLRKRSRSRAVWSCAAAVAAAAVLGPAAHGQTARYWDLNGSTAGAGGPAPAGTWDTALANWNTDATGSAAGTVGAWVAGDDAIFSAGTDATGTYAVTLAAAQTANSLLVRSGTVQLAGSGVTVTGLTTVNGGATLSIDSSTRLPGSGAVLLDGGTLLQTNPSSAGSFVASTKTIQIGVNGGAVGYASSGTGTVSIYGSGASAGATIVRDPTAPAAALVTLTKVGAGEFRYQGQGMATSSYDKLVVTAGLFRLGSQSGFDTERGFGAIPAAFMADQITLNGGSIGTSFGTTLNANRGVTVGANGGGINVGGASLTIPGAVSGSGVLTVTGTVGTATLSSAQNATTFTGSLVVDGLLTLNESLNARSLSGGSPGGTQAGVVTVASGKTLTVGGDNSSFTFTGRVAGAGTLVKSGTGTWTLSPPTNEFSQTGPFNINAGTVKFGTSAAGFASTSALTIAAGATLDMNAINDTFGNLSGGGSIINGANVSVGGNTASATFSGNYTGTGTFTKTGTGIQTLSGVNTFSAVNLNAGRINFNSNTSAGSGTITVANAAGIEFVSTAPNITLANPVTLSGGAPVFYATSGNALRLTGAIGGAGGITRTDTGAGTLTLAGNNTFAGGVTITSRTIVLGSPTALGTGTFTVGDAVTAPANPIVVSADTPLTGGNAVANAVTVNQTFQLGGTNPIELTGALSGTGGLTKSGAASHVLGGAAANTYAGLTTVAAGVLSLNKPAAVNAIAGNVQLGDATGAGTLRLLAPNQVADAANLTITNGATLDLNGQTEALGTLTLAGNGTIDFGAGATSVLAFADSSAVTPAWAAASVLTVTNWNGVPNVGGGTEQLRVGTTGGGLTTAQLAQVQFVLPGGTFPAAITPTGEVVAVVPEPGSAAAVALAGALGLLARRRRARGRR